MTARRARLQPKGRTVATSLSMRSKETAATSHKDNHRAAHDRDIFQKIIILTDLLRAGREFPIAVRYHSSHHHKREYQNRVIARANAQYQASRD